MPWFRKIRVEGSSSTFSDLDVLRSAIGVYCQDTSNDPNDPIEDWDVSSMTTMKQLFDSSVPNRNTCNPDISDWNVSNVVDFKSMFYSAYAFNADISNWDVSSGTTFDGMFDMASSFNANISNWDVSSGTNFKSMFYSASAFNADISNWDVSSGTNFRTMFSSASAFNADISNWNVSSGTNFEYMFYSATGSAFNADISNWDVSSGTTFASMFRSASAFNADISNWDVSSGTNFASMFYYASAFNADISNWNVSSGTNFASMFRETSAFNADISNWDVSSGTNFEYMFYSASAFNQNLTCWKDFAKDSSNFCNKNNDSCGLLLTCIPTYSEAEKFQWDINLIKSYMDGQSSILVDFKISNRDYKIDVFQSDCTIPVNDALEMNKEDTKDLGNGFQNVTVSLDVNQTMVEGSNSDIWTSTTTGGEIKFCLTMSLFLNETNDILVNFLSTTFKIIVDMTTAVGDKTAGFEVKDILTATKEVLNATDGNVDYEENINAFQCEDNYEISSPRSLNQGDILQVCIQVGDPTSIFEVSEVYSFTIQQNPNITVNVISDNGDLLLYPALTDVETEIGVNNIIKVKFQLVGDFFNTQAVTLPPLTVTGNVLLALKSRRLQDSTVPLHNSLSVSRNLQEQNSKFSLEVDLAQVKTSEALKNNANIVSSIVFSCGLYNLW